MQSPQTRDEILRALDQQETESTSYWNAFDTASFFRPIGSSWSPSDTVRHLTKSTRPVVKALEAPKLFLRIAFGKSSRPSVHYDDLVTRYRGVLAEGGKAGRYAPSSRAESDPETWRRNILSTYADVQRKLREAIAPWPENKLDQLQLPHPLLGKLTVREMLFFTLYHQRHHMAVVARHLQEEGA